MTRAETDEFIESLAHPLKRELAELCRIVRSADPRIDEEIKWNAPSFRVDEHFATTNLRPRGPLLLILHAGARKRDIELRTRVADPGSLLTWKSADRAILEFSEPGAVAAREPAVTAILRDWIAAIQA